MNRAAAEEVKYRRALGIESSVVAAERAVTGYAITVEGLRKRYGSLLAVDGISFSVKNHEIFGILGRMEREDHHGGDHGRAAPGR
jgi:ABC-type glutathione transport system ATPase component